MAFDGVKATRDDAAFKSEISALKTELSTALGKVADQQAAASAQIDTTSRDLQQLAVAMKEHDEKMAQAQAEAKATQAEASRSVQSLAETLNQFMQTSARMRNAQERGLTSSAREEVRARAATLGEELDRAAGSPAMDDVDGDAGADWY
mmetsp:Transcript_11919/g.35101  ORF Transcript_11919/g.35101 Transcript_11919/m.35101 type:complete len:149 (+) Transcript_11919:1197-1643(+)